jgi:hypothetical protein
LGTLLEKVHFQDQEGDARTTSRQVLGTQTERIGGGWNSCPVADFGISSATMRFSVWYSLRLYSDADRSVQPVQLSQP